MNLGRKNDKWMEDIEARQRNVVFPDTVRNLGGFWRGIYEQKLTVTQSIGLGILFLFYVVFLIVVLRVEWPAGDATFFQKLVYDFGPQVLLGSFPFLLFFAILHWTLRRRKR